MKCNIFYYSTIRIIFEFFSSPNTNTNIFGLKIWTEYEYEYIWFENFNRIRIRILFGFWKAPNNSVFEYIRSKLFEYIRIPNYSLTSDSDHPETEQPNSVLVMPIIILTPSGSGDGQHKYQKSTQRQQFKSFAFEILGNLSPPAVSSPVHVRTPDQKGHLRFWQKKVVHGGGNNLLEI